MNIQLGFFLFFKDLVILSFMVNLCFGFLRQYEAVNMDEVVENSERLKVEPESDVVNALNEDQVRQDLYSVCLMSLDSYFQIICCFLFMCDILLIVFLCVICRLGLLFAQAHQKGLSKPT